MMIQERLKRSNLILLLGAGVVVGLTLLRAHARLWRAGGRGYLHQCYPRRAQRRLHLFAETGCWLGHRHGQLRGAAIQPV